MLPVDRPQDPFALGHLERAQHRIARHRLELERLVARDDHRAGNRRQVARLAALLVIGDQLVDLLADDLALIGLLAGRDPPLEQVPSDLGLAGAPADAGRRLLAVAEDLEPDDV